MSVGGSGNPGATGAMVARLGATGAVAARLEGWDQTNRIWDVQGGGPTGPAIPAERQSSWSGATLVRAWRAVPPHMAGTTSVEPLLPLPVPLPPAPSVPPPAAPSAKLPTTLAFMWLNFVQIWCFSLRFQLTLTSSLLRSKGPGCAA